MIFTAKVDSVKKVGKDAILLSFNKELEFKPGQFLMVSLPCETMELKRPFSILGGHPLKILIKVRGDWTRKFAQVRVGDIVEFIGPLGNGFPDVKNSLLLVAGGIGIAGLWSMLGKGNFIYGAKTSNELYLKDEIPQPVFFTTEDGSFGKMGIVTDILPDFLDSTDYIFSCGPRAMIEAIQKIAKGKKHFALLEERMACGLGLCFSCAVMTEEGVKLCCKDGPVFDVLCIREFGE